MIGLPPRASQSQANRQPPSRSGPAVTRRHRPTDGRSSPGVGLASRREEGPPPLVEAFAVGVLVLGSGAFFALRAPSDGGSSLVLFLWLCAYGVAVAGFMDTTLRRQRLPRPPFALLAFVGLALASPLWSVAPAVSLRRAIALAGTVMVGLFLSQHMRAVDILEAVRRAAILICFASLLLLAANDPRALDPTHGTLRGVVAHKNTLGQLMAVGIIAAVTVALVDRSRGVRSLLSCLPLAAALVLAGSAGGFILAVLGLLLLGTAALWLLDGGKNAAPGAMLALLAAGVVALGSGVNAGTVLALAGRDPTLTGRTDIWIESLRAASERPLLGSGYGAFWGVGSSSDSPAAARISARLAEPVANAHNGMLDLTLDLGIVGALLAALTLGVLLRQGVRLLREGDAPHGALSVVVVVLITVSTLGEGGLLKENSLLTVVLAAAAGAASSRSRTGSGTTWADAPTSVTESASAAEDGS